MQGGSFRFSRRDPNYWTTNEHIAKNLFSIQLNSSVFILLGIQRTRPELVSISTMLFFALLNWNLVIFAILLNATSVDCHMSPADSTINWKFFSKVLTSYNLQVFFPPSLILRREALNIFFSFKLFRRYIITEHKHTIRTKINLCNPTSVEKQKSKDFAAKVHFQETAVMSFPDELRRQYSSNQVTLGVAISMRSNISFSLRSFFG